MASSDTCNDDLCAGGIPSELEIVDTFTKLIFGQDEELSLQERGIVQVLREEDGNVALDDLSDMGVYLRALGVREMLSLVSRVRQGYPPQGQPQSRVSPHLPIQF